MEIIDQHMFFWLSRSGIGAIDKATIQLLILVDMQPYSCL